MMVAMVAVLCLFLFVHRKAMHEAMMVPMLRFLLLFRQGMRKT
jgi:hypothetical protein